MELMGLRRPVLVALGALALAGAFVPTHARAASFVQGTVVAPEVGGGPPDFLPPPQVGCYDPKPIQGVLKKRELGKAKMSSSTKPGDSGATIQLILVNVDCDGTVPYTNADCTGVQRPFPCCTGVGTGSCATAGACPAGAANDAGSAGKCSASGDMLELQVSQFIAPTVIIRVGIPFNLVGGKSLFGNGLNKTNGTIFGPLVTAGFNQAIFVRGINAHGKGAATPTTCPDPPVPAADPCLSGEVFGRLGLVQQVDATVPGCTVNTECPLADICTAPFCSPEPCTVDADCDQNGTGDGGTLQCGADNHCCDATVEGVPCSSAH